MTRTYIQMICDQFVWLPVYYEKSPFKGLICKPSTPDPILFGTSFWLGSVLDGATVVKDDHPNVLSMEDVLCQKRGRYASYLYKVIINTNANDTTKVKYKSRISYLRTLDSDGFALLDRTQW